MKTTRTVSALLLILGAAHLPAETTSKPAPRNASDTTETTAGEATATISKIALFKNGYGFVTLVVDNKDNKDLIRLSGLPVPSHGTFWAETDGKTEIKLIVGKTVRKNEPLADFGMLDLARANPGADIRLTTGKGNVISGKVETTTTHGKQAALAPAYRSAYQPAPVPAMPFLMVKGETGLTLVPATEIASVEFPGLANVKLPTATVDEPCMELHLGNVDPADPVRITCITSGITWMPSYKFELGGDGKGRFSAQAEIVNDLADIDKAQAELITGFPSIEFPRTPAPISMKLPLNDFFASLNNSSIDNSGIRSNIMIAQQRYMAAGSAMGDSGSAVSAFPLQPNDTIRAEDLFFYPVRDFSCPKGETLAVPLFSGTLPYDHIMTWDIPNNEVRRNRSSYEADASRDIWHCIRITNEFDTPFTTAPVEFISDGRFIGQGTSSFTPPGQKSVIRLNKAMDVIADDSERAVAHESTQFYGSSRVKATTEGTLTITNTSAKPITIIITKNVIGFIDSASDGGTFSQTQALYHNINPLGTIKWELTVPPKEKKNVTYTYYFYN